MSLCDNAIASVSSSEKLREKRTWSVPASGSFGKRPQWAVPKGRKQMMGPTLLPPVYLLRMKPLSQLPTGIISQRQSSDLLSCDYGESVCVHACLCVYVCVEARNGCWASLNITSSCCKMVSQLNLHPDLVRQADHQPQRPSSLYFLKVWS